MAWRGRRTLGVQPRRGGREIAEGIFPRAGEGTGDLVFHRGDRHGRASTRAPEPGEVDGIPTVGVHAGAGLVGNQGRRDHPAAMSRVRQRTIEPIPTGARGVDTAQRGGRRVTLADAVIDAAGSGAEAAKGADLSRMIVRAIGHRHGILVDSQPDGARASLGHG